MKDPKIIESSSIANASCTVRSSFKFIKAWCGRSALAAIVALITVSTLMSVAQQPPPQPVDGSAIHGTVFNLDGKPVGDAVVRLEQNGAPGAVETKTNAVGAFTFSAVRTGSYRLSAEKSGMRSRATTLIAPSRADQKKFDLVLEGPETVHADASPSPSSATPAMEFADKPNFTVAGVTDWTAVGGHGSDSSLRISEDLASATLMLKPEAPKRSAAGIASRASKPTESESTLRAELARAPGSFEANHQLGEFYLHAARYQESIPLLQRAYQIDPANHRNAYDMALAYEGCGDFSRALQSVRELLAHEESADLHRLGGELDEKQGDPLAAVHEFEQAVRLEPTEQNYFDWGSELLLHRAVWQAQEVFHKGADAYPKSARMLTGLGTALFAGALYEEAAVRLCDASDLNPADPEPYIFMGKIQIAAPNPLPCVEPRLARFVQQQPTNSLADYFYAMAILKRQERSPDTKAVQQAEALLTKAVTIDAKCADAYLQLGILSTSQHTLQKAVDFYTKAIEANPNLSEAHYRLGVAYDRLGKPEKAKQEFRLHDEIKKQQSEEIDRQRREIKQFLVVLPGQTPPVSAH